MSTLYISDLDGTLLQPDATLSAYTIETLNSLIKQGLPFSIATARTIASVRHIMKDVTLTLPIVLMNGVCLYDMKSKKYIKVHSLNDNMKQFLSEKLSKHQLHGFYYCIEMDELKTYYDELSNESMIHFYQERKDRYQKPFTKVSSFDSIKDEPLIYVCLMDTHERLQLLYDEINAYPQLNCAFYPDNYTNNWYLEIFHHDASKYHTTMYLKEYVGYDRIVAFGDNKNDIPLFQASDEAYAVENAVKDLKEIATSIIQKNTEDGVVNFINAHYFKK